MRRIGICRFCYKLKITQVRGYYWTKNHNGRLNARMCDPCLEKILASKTTKTQDLNTSLGNKDYEVA